MSFIHVPPGYDGPSEFQIASRNTINQEAQKFIREVNHHPMTCECGNPQCEANSQASETPGYRPSRPREMSAFPRLRALQRPRKDNVPNTASLIDFSSAPDVKPVDQNAEINSPLTAADMNAPLSSLPYRLSFSGEDYGIESSIDWDLEEELAMMSELMGRPDASFEDIEADLKELREKAGLSKVEKPVAKKSTDESGRSTNGHWKPPKQEKGSRAEAKMRTIKAEKEGRKKTKQTLNPGTMVELFDGPDEGAMDALARARSEGKLPPAGTPSTAARLPTPATAAATPTSSTHTSAVIPITDDEAAEGDSSETASIESFL